MRTTIQVNDDTMISLNQLRIKYGASSYDLLLKILIRKIMRSKHSLWGHGGKMTMKGILENLRDKTNKY